MARSPTVRLPPFQALLDDNRDALWRFLVAHVGPHDAADCFQETMLSALRAYPSLRDGSNLRGWLFTIAHRKVIDLVRARGRQAIPTDEPPEVPSDDRQAMAGVEANGDLWPAVRRLPLKQRTAVVARFVADLPYADIAVMSGSSEEAARQNVRAGLANLRKVVTP